MKIRMLADADHRVFPAVMQAFRAGRTYSVPKATADALIGRGKAEPHDPRPGEAPGFRSRRAAELSDARDDGSEAAPAEPEQTAATPLAAEPAPSTLTDEKET